MWNIMWLDIDSNLQTNDSKWLDSSWDSLWLHSIKSRLDSDSIRKILDDSHSTLTQKACDSDYLGTSLPEVEPDPESTPAGLCVFLSDPDPELKIWEKPDLDPKSLVNFGSSRSLCQIWSDSGFFLSDPILFLKNDIRIRSESCFGLNHTIRKCIVMHKIHFLCCVYCALLLELFCF